MITFVNKGQKYPAEVLTRDEVSDLLAAFSKRGSAGLRNRALVVLLWRSGLRIGEALALKLKDIDGDKGSLRVLHGKGDKARTVGIDAGALAVVDLWLVRRKKLGIPAKSPLFCRLDGKPMQPVGVRTALKRAARKAGIDKRVHPHQLRHTHASELRGEGVDIGVISKQLGHSHISTTSRYLDHVAPQLVIDVVSARSW